MSFLPAVTNEGYDMEAGFNVRSMNSWMDFPEQLYVNSTYGDWECPGMKPEPEQEKWYTGTKTIYEFLGAFFSWLSCTFTNYENPDVVC